MYGLIHSIDFPASKIIYDSDMILGQAVYTDWFSVYDIFGSDVNVIHFQGSYMSLVVHLDQNNATDSVSVWIINSPDLTKIYMYPILNVYSGVSARTIAVESRLNAKYNRLMFEVKSPANNITLHATVALRAF